MPVMDATHIYCANCRAIRPVGAVRSARAIPPRRGMAPAARGGQTGGWRRVAEGARRHRAGEGMRATLLGHIDEYEREIATIRRNAASAHPEGLALALVRARHRAFRALILFSKERS